MSFVVAQFLNTGGILSAGNDEFWLGWGEVSRSSHSKTHTLSFYAPDFFLKDQKPWWNFPHSTKMHRNSLRELLQEALDQGGAQPTSGDIISNASWSPPDFVQFQTTFQDLMRRFRTGELRKGVPVVFERALLEVGIQQKLAFLMQLLLFTRELPVYLYGVWNAAEGILGATPELLFQKERSSKILHTVALAGTRLKEDYSRPPLLSDPKEREEHQIVVDGIRSSLAELGQVVIEGTRELKLPTLSHLLTPIQIWLNERSSLKTLPLLFEETVICVHPTPALGAFPKVEGSGWLRDHESRVPRFRFGAPFGVIDGSGDSLCVVGIRNLQWISSAVWLGAGCGIIPASDLEREWREILGKMESIKKMFGHKRFENEVVTE